MEPQRCSFQADSAWRFAARPWPVLSDALKLWPASLRSNLPWLLFGAGIAIEFMAVRLAVQRAHLSIATPPSSEPDIVATGGLPSRVTEASELPAMTEPITGGQVPHDPNRLPGAVRGYRGGVHEGVDFSCLPGTPVIAAADGMVRRQSTTNRISRESRRNELLRVCRGLGETPPSPARTARPAHVPSPRDRRWAPRHLELLASPVHPVRPQARRPCT